MEIDNVCYICIYIHIHKYCTYIHSCAHAQAMCALKPISFLLLVLPGVNMLWIYLHGVNHTFIFECTYTFYFRLSCRIHLDTLSESKFASITRRDGRGINRVLASVYKAVARNLPVKINCVLMRGTNDDEIADFIALSKDVRHLFVSFHLPIYLSI